MVQSLYWTEVCAYRDMEGLLSQLSDGGMTLRGEAETWELGQGGWQRAFGGPGRWMRVQG